MNAELEKLVVIAKDSNMFPEVLKSLYAMFKDNEDFNTELRKGLSENPNCPTDVLEKLIKDNFDEVRINVAKHKRANDKMLSVCTKDENRLVIFIKYKTELGILQKQYIANRWAGCLYNDDKNVLCFTDCKVTILPNPWSGKHFVSANLNAPLKATIFLKQGKTNKVKEFSSEDDFPLLLSQIDLPKYGIKEEWEKLIDSLLELQLYLYKCNMEAEAFYTFEKQLRNRGVFE